MYCSSSCPQLYTVPKNKLQAAGTQCKQMRYSLDQCCFRQYITANSQEAWKSWSANKCGNRRLFIAAPSPSCNRPRHHYHGGWYKFQLASSDMECYHTVLSRTPAALMHQLKRYLGWMNTAAEVMCAQTWTNCWHDHPLVSMPYMSMTAREAHYFISLRHSVHSNNGVDEPHTSITTPVH